MENIAEVDHGLESQIGKSKLALQLLLEQSRHHVVLDLIENIQACIFLPVTLLNSDEIQAAKDAEELLENLSFVNQNVILMAQANYFKPSLRLFSAENVSMIMAETLAEIDLIDHSKLSMFKDGALEPPLRFLVKDDLEVAIATTAQEADCEQVSLLESEEDTFKLSTNLDGGAKSFSISGTAFQGQISFRDKVLGTKSAPPMREKIDLLRENLVRIEYEDGNRLLPKVHLDDKVFTELCYPWSKIDRTLVWARIPDLNVVFYNESFLLTLASALGTPIRVDMNTVNVTRGKFARICIEVDLDKPVVGKVWIHNHWHNVEYEGLHIICNACGCYGHVARNCSSKNNVQMQSQGSAEHDNRKVSAEDIPTNMVEEGELPNRIISNMAPVNQVTRSSPQALHGDWLVVTRNRKVNSKGGKGGIAKDKGSNTYQNKYGVLQDMQGNSEGIKDLGNMWDPTTLGSLANHEVKTVPKNIGKEKQVDAPNQTGSGAGSMKNKRARKSEEIHVMINPITLRDREGQFNRKKNGKEKLGLSPIEKDFVFGKSMLDDSHKNIIQHNQANNTSFHDLGKIVQDATNMRSNLEALSNNSHLHTERGDKEGDARMILGPGNEINQ
ncbi:hypothetical protein SADUNF_Sadunf15G0007800 [Salix dunnii]|uniref:CCHC-type domain-containing protein n=1 Tax=Salix dunnii TaxID=1413687 RepID=A0A835MKL1_9ROSI|nr:hypothetical protein SADUNF_Sadunf15G0007800 [Salix dunnii]